MVKPTLSDLVCQSSLDEKRYVTLRVSTKGMRIIDKKGIRKVVNELGNVLLMGIANSFAAGVFLSLGLTHLLKESNETF